MRTKRKSSTKERVSVGILIIIIALLATLSVFNGFGVAGQWIKSFLLGTFGLAAYGYSIVFVLVGIAVAANLRPSIPFRRAVKYLLLFSLGVFALHIYTSASFISNNNYGQYISAVYSSAGTAGGAIAAIFSYVPMKVLKPEWALLIVGVLFLAVVFLAIYPLIQNRAPYRAKRSKINQKPQKEPRQRRVTISDPGVYPEKEQAFAAASSDKAPSYNRLYVGGVYEDAPSQLSGPSKRRFKNNGGYDYSYPAADFDGEIYSVDERRDKAKNILFGDPSASGKKTSSARIAGYPEDYDDDLSVSSSRAFPGDAKLLPGRGSAGLSRGAYGDGESFGGVSRQAESGRVDAYDRNASGGRPLKDSGVDRTERTPRNPVVREDIVRQDGFEGDNSFNIGFSELEEKLNMMEDQKPDTRSPFEKRLDELKSKNRQRSEEQGGEKEGEEASAKDEKGKAYPAGKDGQSDASGKGVLKGSEGNMLSGAGADASSGNAGVGSRSEARSDRGFAGGYSDRARDAGSLDWRKIYDDTLKEKTGLDKDGFDAVKEESEKEDKNAASVGSEASKLGFFDKKSPAKQGGEKTTDAGTRKPNNSKASGGMEDLTETRDIKEPERKDGITPIGRPALPPISKPKENGLASEVRRAVSSKAPSAPKEAPGQISIEDTFKEHKVHMPYKKPPFNLLIEYPPLTEEAEAYYQETSNVIESVLSSFSISANVSKVIKGPTFSRYVLEIGEGVDIKKIENLDSNLSARLGGENVDILAPIPGMGGVGIDVPNKEKAIIGMKELICSDEYKNNKSKLCFALGKDLNGKIYVCDLAKMPHLLIAGATNSGKSVCINSLIVSMLYNASPEEVKFIMIDPKMVELTIFKGIPHMLINDIISEPDHAVNAFTWAVEEMYKRFRMFTELFNSKNISDYNRYAQSEGREKLPYIVIVIDELANLIASKRRKDIEEKILRLASLARAAGIHLVVATQRPSVDNVPGSIKANLPSRIAFNLTSIADAKTIFNGGGPEKLLGRGDMLYHPSDALNPSRLQGGYLDNMEVFNIVKYIKENNEAFFDEEIQNKIFKMPSQPQPEDNAPGGTRLAAKRQKSIDPLMFEAMEAFMRNGKVTVSSLQRWLRIGFTKAGSIVDDLERLGMISPADSKNNRTILISQEELDEMKEKAESGVNLFDESENADESDL